MKEISFSFSFSFIHLNISTITCKYSTCQYFNTFKHTCTASIRTYHPVRNNSVLGNLVHIGTLADCPIGQYKRLRCSKRNSSIDRFVDRTLNLRILYDIRIDRICLRWCMFHSCTTLQCTGLYHDREKERERLEWRKKNNN